MGDRANIIIHSYDGQPPVIIYTHWHGSELPKLLAKALDTPQARSRVGDPAYLARIIFCQIMKQVDDLDGETGWGISTGICDNEHPFLHVDAMSGQVAVSGDDLSLKGQSADWRSFDEFVAAVASRE